jgi:hypothetical protein
MLSKQYIVKFADFIDTKPEYYRPANAANFCCQLWLLTCAASFGCLLVLPALAANLFMLLTYAATWKC